MSIHSQRVSYAEWHPPSTSYSGVANSENIDQLLKKSPVEKSSSCLGRARKFSIRGLRTDALTSTVIKESDTKYRLTGINMVQRTSDLFYAPKDPAIARIGGKKSARYDHRVFTKFYTASVGRQPGRYPLEESWLDILSMPVPGYSLAKSKDWNWRRPNLPNSSKFAGNTGTTTTCGKCMVLTPTSSDRARQCQVRVRLRYLSESTNRARRSKTHRLRKCRKYAWILSSQQYSTGSCHSNCWVGMSYQVYNRWCKRHKE